MIYAVFKSGSQILLSNKIYSFNQWTMTSYVHFVNLRSFFLIYFKYWFGLIPNYLHDQFHFLLKLSDHRNILLLFHTFIEHLIGPFSTIHTTFDPNR